MKLPTFKKPTISADQSFEAVPQVIKKGRFDWRAKLNQLKTADKKVKLLFILIPATILLLLLSLTVGRLQEEEGRGILTKQPTPTQPPPTELLSEYATHSAILKMEEKVKKLEEEMSRVDLNEAALNPPVLEWKVEF